MLRKEGLSEKKEKRNIREDKAQVQREKLEAEQAKKREEESSSRARKPKLIGVHAEGNLKEKRLAKIVFHLGIRKKSLLADGHVVVETLTHDYTDSDEEESD
jgi:hypothetical protein